MLKPSELEKESKAVQHILSKIGIVVRWRAVPILVLVVGAYFVTVNYRALNTESGAFNLLSTRIATIENAVDRIERLEEFAKNPYLATIAQNLEQLSSRLDLIWIPIRIRLARNQMQQTVVLPISNNNKVKLQIYGDKEKIRKHVKILLNDVRLKTGRYLVRSRSLKDLDEGNQVFEFQLVDKDLLTNVDEIEFALMFAIQSPLSIQVSKNDPSGEIAHGGAVD